MRSRAWTTLNACISCFVLREMADVSLTGFLSSKSTRAANAHMFERTDRAMRAVDGPLDAWTERKKRSQEPTDSSLTLSEPIPFRMSRSSAYRYCSIVRWAFPCPSRLRNHCSARAATLDSWVRVDPLVLNTRSRLSLIHI